MQHPATTQLTRVNRVTRLTHRGRVALLLLLVLFAFATVSALRTVSQAATGPARPASHYVTVAPGQTLWQIARSVAPADDPRDTIDRIRDLNGLGTETVRAGQRLVVPG